MSTATVSRKTSKTSEIEDNTLTDTTETIVATEPAKHVHEFRVVHTGVLLTAARRGELFSRAIIGDVAQLSTGELMARAASMDGDNRVEYAYAPFHSDPRIDGEFSPSFPRWRTKLNSEIETLSCLGVRHLTPTTTMEEISRFRRDFPWIASKLGLEAHRPSPIFNAGLVTYVFGQNKGGLLNLDELHDLLDRHQAGDWGNHGFMDYTELSPEDRWCVDMLTPVNRRNSASVLLGEGPVLSEYVLPDTLQAEYRRRFQVAQWVKETGVARITTILRGGIGTSLITFATAAA